MTRPSAFSARPVPPPVRPSGPIPSTWDRPRLCRPTASFSTVVITPGRNACASSRTEMACGVAAVSSTVSRLARARSTSRRRLPKYSRRLLRALVDSESGDTLQVTGFRSRVVERRTRRLEPVTPLFIQAVRRWDWRRSTPVPSPRLSSMPPVGTPRVPSRENEEVASPGRTRCPRFDAR